MELIIKITGQEIVNMVEEAVENKISSMFGGTAVQYNGIDVSDFTTTIDEEQTYEITLK